MSFVIKVLVLSQVIFGCRGEGQNQLHDAIPRKKILKVFEESLSDEPYTDLEKNVAINYFEYNLNFIYVYNNNKESLKFANEGLEHHACLVSVFNNTVKEKIQKYQKIRIKINKLKKLNAPRKEITDLKLNNADNTLFILKHLKRISDLSKLIDTTIRLNSYYSSKYEQYLDNLSGNSFSPKGGGTFDLHSSCTQMMLKERK